MNEELNRRLWHEISGELFPQLEYKVGYEESTDEFIVNISWRYCCLIRLRKRARLYNTLAVHLPPNDEKNITKLVCNVAYCRGFRQDV